MTSHILLPAALMGSLAMTGYIKPNSYGAQAKRCRCNQCGSDLPLGRTGGKCKACRIKSGPQAAAPDPHAALCQDISLDEMEGRA